MSGNWNTFYDVSRGELPPRPTLVAALDAWGGARPGRAIDLGCGAGRDTLALLHRGWGVVAVDAEAEALDRLRRHVPPEAGARLVCMHGRFEDVSLPEADIVNASFALPFCARSAFPEVWRKVAAALKPGGLFAGQLFGHRDGWAAGNSGRMTFHSRGEIETLAQDCERILFREEEEDGATASGEPKHWHVFHLVLRLAVPGMGARDP